MDIEIKLGSILELKKGHPCGANRWEIIRFGTDCKIKCLGCGRIVLIDRPTLKKRVKKILEEKSEEHS
ncbi:MAG: DUF951 domain-containing protein [Candidatus Izemoplasmatales bacterium]|jgi:hypothetical protein|nr:DUF951 domain-containing protein [Candidatus Izemoplasmatales bacterium]